MSDTERTNLNAQIKALNIAVHTIAEHLHNTSEGFTAVANNRAANEAANIPKMTTTEAKTFATEVVEHLKDLLLVPDA